MFQSSKRFILILISALCLGAPVAALAEPLPVELFFKNPQYRNFRLSPDGRTLAVLFPVEDKGTMNIVTIDIQTAKTQLLTSEDVDVSRIEWANNDRILYWLESGEYDSWTSRFRGGIYAIDKDGQNFRTLVQPFQGRSSFGRSDSGYTEMIHRLPEDEDSILVTNNQRRAEYPDVYRLNVNNGTMKRLLLNPSELRGYMTDHKGRVRGGFEYHDDGRMVVFTRSLEGEWRKLAEFESDYEAWSPVGYWPSKDSWIMSFNQGRDTRALRLLDMETGRFADDILLEDPVYDIEASVLRDFRSDDVVGVSYEGAKPVFHFFNDEYEKLYQLLNEALPNAVNIISDVDAAGTKAVLYSYSDSRGPEYYMLDLKSLNMQLLGKAYPWLEGVALGRQIPISYAARDGRRIHGYITLPPDYRDGERVPLVAMPHGGPWARDDWGFTNYIEAMPKFLASRGFAVLELNFRGSSGYGKDHLKSSFKKMGDMHNDVIDGIRWAINEGYADEDRLGIMGASWGGYATMIALVKEPDMFQFGVNLFGVVDFVEHINRYRKWDREIAYNYWLERMGDPEDPEDRRYLDEWSPMSHIEKIKAPVFIYHGLEDLNVHIEQSRMLVRELERLDHPHQVVYRTQEMHSAFNEKNRIDLYRQIDEFLKPYAPAWNN